MKDPAGLRRAATDQLSDADVSAIRTLLWAAFPPGEEAFTEDDWEHALGGLHVILEVGEDRRIVAHAAVVEREIHVGGRPVRAGYVEAVAVDPSAHGRGLGSLIMRDVAEYLRGRFELGVLGTGAHHFYERLGWRTWRGPSGVRVDGATIPTPDDDGYILVLETPTSPVLDLTAPITCDWRPGDVW
jgi:aminoglycoside 2'-N-acetyltransferase I